MFADAATTVGYLLRAQAEK
ncbi:unnamed protein product, partial [Rotaria sordida]